MNKQDFYFDLPEELIAQYPLANRSDSRLLVYNRKTEMINHHRFKEIGTFLEPGDLLVLNNSKVIPARFYGSKASGGKVELLVERLYGDNTFLAHIKASKSPKAGTFLFLDKGWQVEVLSKPDDLYHCRVLGDVNLMLQQIGHIPLPLYITRPDEAADMD
nr:S-adenosylmethionine:tRNA ribosyltransferase-isomerase [Tatlockia sp.]